LNDLTVRLAIKSRNASDYGVAYLGMLLAKVLSEWLEEASECLPNKTKTMSCRSFKDFTVIFHHNEWRIIHETVFQ